MAVTDERREPGQRVTFDRNTWISIIGLVLVMMGMGAALARFTFQTQAEATSQASNTLAEANQYTDKQVERRRQVVDRDTKRLEDNQRAIMNRLEVIGDRLGVGNRVREYE